MVPLLMVIVLVCNKGFGGMTFCSDQSNVSPSLDHLTLPTAVFVHDQVDNPVDFLVHL